MTETGRRALVVGVSGASSSGKTTLSRLLRDIFPNTFILHEDDFYKQDKDIPVKDGLADWDCVEALVIPDIVTALDHIRTHGTFPPQFNSKEDQNEVGKCPVPESTIAELKDRVHKWTQPGNPGHGILDGGPSALRLCIFDGFLLYSPALQDIQQYMDIKLFLRVSYAKAKARREARSGYVTLEGFWEDPPGYVDKIVWPNYVADHKWMFEDDNVEGSLKPDFLKEWRIETQTGRPPDVDMETTLKWCVEVLMEKLEKLSPIQN